MSFDFFQGYGLSILSATVFGALFFTFPEKFTRYAPQIMYFWIGGMTGFIIAVIAFRNVNDTYYAVKIYGLPEKEKTVEFLYNSLKPQQAVVAIAMAIEGLAILGAKDLTKEGLSLVFEKYKPLEGKFAVGLGGSEEFGTATPLEATYWVLRAFKATDYKVPSEERRRIKDFIESFRKGDGYGVTQAGATVCEGPHPVYKSTPEPQWWLQKES
ncbi:hypothetical protein ADU37_CDS04140 [Thermococcus sp. 2319x1]|nr:hypothetical protein ADU37_CDS04140 [Thermococcus sp. 2319x1]